MKRKFIILKKNINHIIKYKTKVKYLEEENNAIDSVWKFL